MMRLGRLSESIGWPVDLLLGMDGEFVEALCSIEDTRRERSHDQV